MKKTLITLMAVAGCVSGAEPVWSGSTPTTYDASALSSFTVDITLDVATLQAESGANFNGSAKVIDLAGTWDGSGMAGTLDINVNGSSSSKTSSLYAGSKAAVGNYNSAYALTGISTTTIFDRNTAWDTIAGASLVFAKDSTGENDAVSACLTLNYTDGSQVVYYGQNTGIKFTVDHDGDSTTPKIVDYHLEVSTVTFAGGFATYAEIYSGAMSETEAKLVGASLAPTVYIPEPATATLSLLALAGLAARRRRR